MPKSDMRGAVSFTRSRFLETSRGKAEQRQQHEAVLERLKQKMGEDAWGHFLYDEQGERWRHRFRRV